MKKSNHLDFWPLYCMPSIIVYLFTLPVYIESLLNWFVHIENKMHPQIHNQHIKENKYIEYGVHVFFHCFFGSSFPLSRLLALYVRVPATQREEKIKAQCWNF